MPNLKKWVNLSFFAMGVLAWFFLREIFALIFDFVGWVEPSWLVPPSDIAGIVTGVGLFIGLVRSSKADAFFSEAYAELTKVTWPKKNETVLSTGVVSVMVAVATLCVLFFDTIWNWVADRILY